LGDVFESCQRVPECQQIGAGNIRRRFPFPGFGGFHTFFPSGTVAVGVCA
jgi:hypothetical protein